MGEGGVPTLPEPVINLLNTGYPDTVLLPPGREQGNPGFWGAAIRKAGCLWVRSKSGHGRQTLLTGTVLLKAQLVGKGQPEITCPTQKTNSRV